LGTKVYEPLAGVKLLSLNGPESTFHSGLVPNDDTDPPALLRKS
jgi:hypothetical protein